MTDQKVHAKLGASSAKRWISCSGSLNFIDSLPAHLLDDSSEFAAEGTAAHEEAERHLRAGTDSDNEYIQVYLDEVRSHDTGFVDIYIEERFKLNDDMFGTNDAIVIDELNAEIKVFDLKYGVGVAVEAEENEQLMYYALGALKRFDPHRRIFQKVTICIVQPRCHHEAGPIRKWETTAERIYMFETILLLAAAGTRIKDAPLSAGKHCRFCPAIVACPAYKKAIVGGMSDVQLSVVYEAAESLGMYKAAIGRVIYKTLMDGKKIEGMKLVEKKSQRKWINPTGITLLLLGDKKTEAFKNELKSPAQLEKIMGKDWVAMHSFKPKGELTVAHENDKRQETSKAALQFADIDGEE